MNKWIYWPLNLGFSLRLGMVLWLAVFFFPMAHAQVDGQPWSLQRCVDYAMENNIAVLQAGLAQELAENDLRLARWNLYSPNLNANASYNFNFGNSLDPTTFDFIRQNTQSSSMSLNMNYNLFEGLGRLYAIDSEKERVVASRFDMKEVEQNTKINIAGLYLQVVLAQSMVELAREQVALSQAQSEQTKTLVEGGVVAVGDYAEVQAVVANDKASLANAENSLDLAYWQLRSALQLSLDEPFVIEDMGPAPENISLQNPLYNSSLLDRPSTMAAEARLRSAQYRLKQAKSSFSPVLSLGSNINTNYFSAAVDFATGQTISAGQQLNDNLAENIGVSLSIPILQKGQRIMAVDNAKLQIEQSKLEVENQRIQHQNEVMQAYNEAVSAQKRFMASVEQKETAEQAYYYAKEKFDAGLINQFEFFSAQNRRVSARLEYTRAQYEYWFRARVLQFYQTGTFDL